MDRPIWPFLLALTIAVVVRLVLPFDGLYGQDALAYYRWAHALWPHLTRHAPLPPLYWPHGYPMAVAAALPIAGGGPLAGQLVSALAGAWSAAATFLLVKELQHLRGDGANPVPRIAAGLCVGGSGIVLRTSQIVMADGLALGLAATALWCAARALRTRRGAWLVLCAVAVAWGATTRWQIGLLALPVAAALAIDRGEHARLPGVWWLVAIAAGLAILVPELVAAHHAPLALTQHEWFRLWSPTNALQRDFRTPEGHARYHFPVAVFYILRLAWPDALFPPILALALVGAWVIVARRRAVDAALLIGWPLVNWAFISGIPYENPRFIWPVLPSIAALAGFGFQAAWSRATMRGRAALAMVLGASIGLGLIFAAREHARHTVGLKNEDLARIAWVDAAVPREATIWQAGGTLLAEEYGLTRMLDVYFYRSTDIPSLLAQHCPCYLLVNGGDGSDHWSGLPSEVFFQSLQRDPGLTPIGTRPPYTLFRINERSR
jgi:hypothetical protein